MLQHHYYKKIPYEEGPSILTRKLNQRMNIAMICLMIEHMSGSEKYNVMNL